MSTIKQLQLCYLLEKEHYTIVKLRLNKPTILERFQNQFPNLFHFHIDRIIKEVPYFSK